MKKILFWLQPLLVFLGVYFALIGFCTQMELSIQKGTLAVIFLLVSYGLMLVNQYLERMPGGKWLGIMAVIVLELVVSIRFFTAVIKGAQYVVNHFLKIFMNYTNMRVELLSYISSDKTLTNGYCVTLFMGVLGVLLIAIISFTFYQKRRTWVFLVCTLPFVLLTIFVGEAFFYIHMLGYVLAAIAVIGTGHMGKDDVSTLARYRATLILIGVVLLCGVVSFLLVTPRRYQKNKSSIERTKQVLEDIASFQPGEWKTWFKANFGMDAIDYGSVGERNEVRYSGETLLEIQSDEGLSGSIYLKGFSGDKFVDNQWKPFDATDGNYLSQCEISKERRGMDINNFHQYLASFMGTTSWQDINSRVNVSTMKIRNIGFGGGNRVLPYYPKLNYAYDKRGKIKLDTLSEYEVPYYPNMRDSLSNWSSRIYDFSSQIYMQDVAAWPKTQETLNQTTEMVRRYYLGNVSQYQSTFQSFFDQYSNGAPFYVADFATQATPNDLPAGYQVQQIPMTETINIVQKYLASQAQYTLSPGMTPEGEDAINYFITKSHKGYCVHFASAAAMLFRLIGIPARYVEGAEVNVFGYNTDVVQVKDSDAHAWVEIYRDQIGWIPVEVTPGMGDGTSAGVNPEATPSPTPQTQATPTPKPDSKEGPVSVATQEPDDTEPQTEETPAPEDTSKDIQDDGQDVTPDEDTSSDEEDMDYDDIDSASDSNAKAITVKKAPHIPTAVKVVLAVVCLILLLVLQYVMRKMMYQRGLSISTKRNRIIKSYLHIRPLLRKYDVAYVTQSQAEYEEELMAVTGLSKDLVRPFVTLLMKAQFSGQAMSREELREYGKCRQKILLQLLKKMNIVRRIYLRCVYGI